MFNRGMKRDNFSNNRNNFGNNRNLGGGNNLASRLGGIVNSNNAGSSNLNPWEGGMVPGGRGILPTPENNLSLTSPQAQLAFASNLISNLLRTQQETQQAPVPSLLSLSNNYSGASNTFSNQQNFNQGRVDRFSRQNMKSQRPQPYNKMGNRARDAVVGRRPQQNIRNQSGNQRQNGNQNQRNDRSSKALSPSKQNIKREPQDKTSNKTNEKAEAPVALSEENEETRESNKREWKDEKKEVFHENKKDESMKSEDEGATKDDDKSTNKRSAARHAESRYSEVPMSSMTCNVCNKRMWDGASFENHLRGRAHQLMMEKLDESYKLKVELMRHELRMGEEQREIALNNSKRRGKKLSVDLSSREYCTMCDLNFLGTLSSHRKSEKHQQLKTFLHPRCFPCGKEFPSRIEYDEHCLTPTHMKHAYEHEEQKKSNKKKEKLNKGEYEIRSGEEDDKDISDLMNEKSDETENIKDFVLDIPEGEIGAKLKIPTYRHIKANQVGIGRSLVKEVTGYSCDKCRRFLLTDEDLQVHLQSSTHYRNFIQEIKTLQAAAAKSAKESSEKKEDESKEASKTKQVKQEEEVSKVEDPSKFSRKRKHGDDFDDEEEEEDIDKYDPTDVNDESEDENVEDDKQDNSRDAETTEITINVGDDNILEENNDNDTLNENDRKSDREEEEEKVEEEIEEPPPKVSAKPATRGAGNQRARGNRARRSRR